MNPALRRWIVVGVAAALVTSGAATSPYALRRLDAFRVERVQVSGARYLGAEQAVTISGITSASSLFDDFAPWEAALQRHPLVLAAKAHRRLPDVLHIEVLEAEPVALLGTPELHPVDARGQVLPIDLASYDLDLPLISGEPRLDAKGRVTDEATLRVLDAIERVHAAQPWLDGWISELEPVRDGVRLRLRWPQGAELLLPFAPGPERLHEVRLAFGHLAARELNPDGAAREAPRGREAGNTELARLIRMDARYQDQVVVTLAQTSEPSRPRATS